MTVTKWQPTVDGQSNFAHWFDTYEDGLFAERADRHLRDLMQAVVALQKKGTVTVKLLVEPYGVGKVVTTAVVESRAPQPDPEQQMFWINLQTGELTLDAPGKSSVSVQMVDTDTGEIVDRNVDL